MATTIRVSRETRDRLAALAQQLDRPMTGVVDQAVDALERQVFFEAFNDGFTRLRGQPDEWDRVLAERTQEAITLDDGGS